MFALSECLSVYNVVPRLEMIPKAFFGRICLLQCFVAFNDGWIKKRHIIRRKRQVTTTREGHRGKGGSKTSIQAWRSAFSVYRPFYSDDITPPSVT